MNVVKTNKCLLMAIGNTGRSDDALAWRFAELVETGNDGSFDVEYRYQLQVEDAELISRYREVIFVDATGEPLEEGFSWNACYPSAHYFYSSHLQSPETVLYLAGELYHSFPCSYVLLMQGCNWNLATALSPAAEANLQRAADYFWKTRRKQVVARKERVS